MMDRIVTPVGIEQTLLALRLQNQGANTAVPTSVRDHALVKEAMAAIDALPLPIRVEVYRLGEQISNHMRTPLGLLAYALVGAIYTAVSEKEGA